MLEVYLADFKLKDGYIILYYIILSPSLTFEDGRIIRPLPLKVEVDGKETEVYYYAYFFSKDKVKNFKINDIEEKTYQK